MLTARQLDRMRTTSTRALPDVGTVTRAGTGQVVFDPTTGQNTRPPAVTVYAGPCRVRKAGAVEQDVQVGELHETLGRYVGTFPWDSGDLQVDDFVTLTSSSDPQLIGRPLRIVDLSVGSNEIDRRVILEDQQQT